MQRFVTFLIFALLMTATYIYFRQPAVTSNFDIKAPHFYVLGTKGKKYEMLHLSETAKFMGDGYTFHLEDLKVELNIGDIHRIEVLEEKNGRQRIQFNYSNSYMSASVYDVINNEVVPVSYRVLSSVGHGFIYIIALVVFSVFAPLVSRSIFWIIKLRKDTQKQA